MSAPKTYDEVVVWFTSPRRGETEGTHDALLLRRLLSGMQARPGFSTPMSPSKAWNLILDYGLLYRGARTGWIMRDGTVLGVNYAAHEVLLAYLGIETADAEWHGWVRFSRRDYQCRYRLTTQQRRSLLDASVLVDDGAERLKPKLTSPDDLAAALRDELLDNSTETTITGPEIEG